MAASNEQVQSFVNERVRPLCEKTRTLIALLDDYVATVDDVYANLTDSPDWSDNRPDNPPTLLTPNDVLAINTFIQEVRTYVKGHANLASAMSACVNTP